MANIKFSAFTQKVVDTDVDFLVGYTGADNVRISPSTIGQGVYLPLTGGTITGDLKINSTSTVFSDKLYVNSNAYTTGGWRVGTAGTYVGQLVNDSGKLTLTSDASRDISFDNVTQGAIMFLEGSNGNVGIGTSSPNEKLHVAGNIHAYDTSADRALFASTAAGSTTVAIRSNGITHFNGGNVGIGTSSPGVKLDVDGQIRSDDAFLLQSGATAIGSIRNQGGALDIRGDSTRNVSIGSVTSPQALFVKGSNGNVGIGTASPSYKFTAYGSSSDSEIVASFGSANDISEYTAIGLSGFIAGNDATKAGLALERTASFGVGKLHFLNNTTIDDSDMTLSDSRMVIDIDGNVGIGTTSPTATLHVESADDALLRLKSTDNKAYIALSDNDTNGYISSENSKLSLGANIGSNANNLNIDLTNNRVGIGTSSPASKLEVDGGDIEIDDSASGLILRSPDGTRYRVTVANGGTLSVSAV